MTFSVEVKSGGLVPEVLPIQPYGKSFFKYVCERFNIIDSSKETESDEEVEQLADSDIVIDLKYIKSLAATEWKDQDHYRVLGIPNLRVQSSTKDVKKAYRFMVLKCHPDKSKGNTKVNEEAFTCIQKAYEQLCTIEGKRAYDSIDPFFDDDVPNVTEYNKQNFFKVYGPVIEKNAQWSCSKNIPRLGTDADSIEKVNEFYNLWFDFNSWREYSYLDEEERDKAECKEERRYIDKANKQERAKRKKEEMTRIRELVNNCYACDPRIKQFNEERKKRKQEAKQAKQEAYRQEQEAVRLRKEEEERIKKEQEEQKQKEAKEKAEVEKKERQKQNKLLKVERKKLRENVKGQNYFCTADSNNIVQAMENLELLLLGLTLDDMKSLNGLTGDVPALTTKYTSLLDAQLKEQENKKRENLVKAKQSQEEHKEQTQNSDKFTTPDIALLVKAVKIFPPGTVNRWNTIADYLNQHSTVCRNYDNQDVIKKVKKLQSGEDNDLKSKVNAQAYENFERSQKQRIDEVQAGGGISNRDTVNSALKPEPEAPKNKGPWTPEEQKLLEEALKKYPAAAGPERWDNISAHVGTRSKKMCMKRYKDLVEQIKAKKAKQ